MARSDALLRAPPAGGCASLYTVPLLISSLALLLAMAVSQVLIDRYRRLFRFYAGDGDGPPAVPRPGAAGLTLSIVLARPMGRRLDRGGAARVWL